MFKEVRSEEFDEKIEMLKVVISTKFFYHSVTEVNQRS